MVIEVARTLGLKAAPPVAIRLADAASGDQAIVTRELEKLALYLDASPHAPKELSDEALDAVGADMPGGDFQRLADLALAGDMRALVDELSRLSRGGTEAIPVVRSLQRRLLMLAPARARMERGDSLDGVMTSLGKSFFWKDKARVSNLLQLWDAEGLATIAERAGALERTLMFSDSPPAETLGEELIAIARSARARR
jgi:DNA polymerase-3 subunit delta